MKTGEIMISTDLICEALGFPPNWRIESASMKKGEKILTCNISGSDFPEEVNGVPKKCTIIIHERQRTFEVKELNS